MKLCAVWPRLGSDVHLDAYARKVLVRTAIDEVRRSSRRHETAVGEPPPVPVAPARVEDVLAPLAAA